MNLFGTGKRKKTVAVEARVELLRALTVLSEVDPLYADLYLDRACRFLRPLCAREEYDRLRREREELPRAVEELRRATDRGDWVRVHGLADEAAAKKEDVTLAKTILEIADAVYGVRTMRATATSLGMHGVVPLVASTIERERAQAIDRLRNLSERDSEWATFYQQRIRHFERMELIPQEDAGMAAGSDGLRLRVLAALERGDFAEVRHLTEELGGGRGGLARARVPVAPDGLADLLAATFSASAIDRAKEFGLIAETLPLASALNGYLSCCCAERTTFPSAPLSPTHRAAEGCTCGHPCPPEVSPTLREGLDLLLVHPFLSSGGTRYLPWFGAETVLIEDFPETSPEAPTRLLDVLNLRGRRGVPRLVIEDALRSHSGDVCRMLGLDPFEFVVACVPFDAYLRLSPRHGWGRQQLWTHFDGYQVTRELWLNALVGGDVRFGGGEDFCAVQRDYDADRLIARFCLLRRARFAVRHHPEDMHSEDGR
jgi:hypothetical protein